MGGSTAHDFAHPALLYRDTDDYLAATVPFVRDGLAAGEPVAAAVPTANLASLRSALGPDADRIAWRDMTVAGRNPGAIIPAVLIAFADAHAGRRVRIIGEPIWAGRTSAEYPACAQHEALINAAFAGRAATILCPYDISALDPAWVDDAHRTHPVMVTATRRWDSRHYTDPVAFAAGFNHAAARPAARCGGRRGRRLHRAARASLRHRAGRAGRPAGRADPGSQPSPSTSLQRTPSGTAAAAAGWRSGSRTTTCCASSATPGTWPIRSPGGSRRGSVPPAAAD